MENLKGSMVVNGWNHNSEKRVDRILSIVTCYPLKQLN